VYSREGAMARKKNRWNQWRKKAPKVPDNTCPLIDDILTDLEKIMEANPIFDEKKFKRVEKKLERLRSQNEALRNSGIYWYEKCKDHLKEIKPDNFEDIKKIYKKIKPFFMAS
tara:strand:+ start:2892 stop:3230 length:339 start_codon:yes stop_codon:yes gene_type:complete